MRAVVGRAAGHAGRRGRRHRPHRHHRAVLAQLAGAGAVPRPPLARPDSALGAGHQGPHLHAHRRHRGGRHDLAPGDPGRRAQLGLPLHVDARHHLHAAGAALPEPRVGGRRVHAVRGRRRAHRGRQPPDHVRHRRPARPDREHPRRADRLQGREAGADRKRRLRPASERRVRRGARLDPAAHAAQQPAAAAAVADRGVTGRVRDRRLEAPRSGHLGGARQAAALRVVEAHVLGGARPRRPGGRDPGHPRARNRLGRNRGGDQGRHPRTRSQRPRRAAPALRDRLAGRLHPAGRDVRPAAGRR